MKVKVLGCYGGQLPGKNNPGFILNGDLLIDAGTIALNSTIEEQRRIRNVIISHPHLDHTGALPFFAVNIVSNKAETVKIAGIENTLNAIKSHILNGVIWPDFTKIKNFGGKEIFEYMPVKEGEWFELGGYTIKAIPVNHTVPTCGFLIGKGGHYIMYSGDTKTTDAIWKEAAALGDKLKSIFMEVSFPGELKALAETSGHYVPQTMEEDLKKLGGIKPKIFVYHIKPEYFAKVKKELAAVKGYKITVLCDKKEYAV
ncbi:MAG: ribonuclease Z [Candidatus Aerophobetes bacterium ADurb.Bin490]|nr:MAG: ribonuclease Z [Candidatus Aerophobetes bacterium ADurb.Bin490]HNZ29935.1 3',5'-cyclic-nucleotide phosphodiesterase [Candidatus Goldiibacteriota bacterium]HPI03313.1 3',5'-cyclic-nucleotide phosphodiesterase [Candidatus Goldiibacteriota bacterium]HPN64778.1 3',5'-cyclic-nucleotide phosphodiesterase [Candidatus Goldiibacteriota bacterium]HRQ43424.1 3',5'-cyclic-nucleotide phosphodiesterase [Candidatus Goldiibacteriota bacterium]